MCDVMRLHLIARLYWVLCDDSAVVVCSDFASASGNFFFFFYINERSNASG